MGHNKFKHKYHLFNKIIAAAVITGMAVVIGVTSLASGSELDDLKKQLNSLEMKIKQQEQRLNEVIKREKTVSNELEIVERKLELTELELQKVEDQLIKTEQKVKKTQQELEEAQKRVEQQTEIFYLRAEAMYKNGPVDYLEVLLDSKSFSDFITRMDILKRIISYDANLLNSLKEQKALIEDKKVELELQRNEILAVRQQISDKKKEIEVQVAARERLLNQIKNDKMAYEKALDEMEEAQRKLNKMIAELQAKQKKGYMGTATFAWPTPGYTRITSPYGWRIHPIYKTRRMHTGIDIGAPAGSNIVAATHGEVIYADWLGGYGKTVVLDHGGGISTMYAHTSVILVEVGQKVRKGQVIAKVGSTGVSTGPHLHFEVKINGNHTDPWKYFE
ncbi:Murein hydrolase activator EnvC [Koleobacter methoxysyntrophicus]|uniref:Murein hydrolase activator EnvC n=1 Tax=Koleobacter methoxysyntrophicus TaxID=2751313 RepID=A0A8A0RPR2_9FIRM|nr:M23 family metallopeptidase [Koleobacter methoxysyntrophicus]QSQ10371.1 Murein hydrolase activator EnvC [Koleobacter methoxysyntrophicus]